MLEWTLTGNLGRDPDNTKGAARCTLCTNVQVNNSRETKAVWVDLEATDIGTAAKLLDLKKGDGVMARGAVRINNYEHAGRMRTGWIMEINQLHVTFIQDK